MITTYDAALASHAVVEHVTAARLDDDPDYMDIRDSELDAIEWLATIDRIFDDPELREIVSDFYPRGAQEKVDKASKEDCEQVRQIILAEYERTIGRA